MAHSTSPRWLAAPVAAITVLSLLGAAPALGGEPCGDVTWSAVGIPARHSHSIVFDPVRNVSMQFGGNDGVVKLGDTSLWNGTTWTRLNVSGPSARESHAMAYDAARDRVILFGGLSAVGSGYMGDTWAWNGTSWQQLSPANSPTPRDRAVMSYDPVRQRIVLFGGADITGSLQNDTWEWDGANWILRATTGPSVRSDHAMTFDASRNRTVLFGGDSNPHPLFISPLNDTWEWDGATWSLRNPAARPAARANHTLTYDPVRQRSVLVAGFNNNPKGAFDNDVWEWDGTNWTQFADLPGEERENHAATFDTTRGRLVMTGGDTPFLLPETWERSGTTWTRAADFSPLPRVAASMAFDAARANIVLYGGPDTRTGLWNGASWTNLDVPGPGLRNGNLLTYDQARQRVVLFGGDSANNDTWEWNGTAWTRVHNGGGSAPPVRWSFGFAYDAARQESVVFGGSGIGGLRFDTWVWNGTSWTVRPVSGPSARTRFGMAYDAARQRVVLFGGFNLAQFTGDTWEWDGTSWQQRSNSGPGNLQDPVLEYDAVRGRVMLIAEGQTWEWDGNAWQQLSAGGLPSLYAPGMAFDAARSRMTVFSGSDYSSQTYQLSPSIAPVVITRQPVNTIGVEGAAVVIDLEATAGAPITYQWRRDGAPLVNGGRISGANTASLTINPALPSDFGVYDATLTSLCGSAESNAVALCVEPGPNPCPADFNNSGMLDSQDFFDFLAAFFTGCP